MVSQRLTQEYTIFFELALQKLQMQIVATHATICNKYYLQGKESMNFTWIDVINLIEQMWEIKPNELAVYLKVNPSTISRIKNGITLQPNIRVEDIYNNLFCPVKKGSRAFGKDPKESLEILKDIIKGNGLDEVTKTLDDSDYKKFVIGLLKLAKSPKNEALTIQNTSSQNITNSTKKNYEPPDMLDEFYQSLEDFAIEDFISKPVESLSSDRIRDAINFIGHIKYINNQEEFLPKNSNIDQHMTCFIDILYKYIEFLKENSINPHDYLINYKPLDGNDPNFKEKTESYCQDLCSLYQNIKREIEFKQDEYKEKQKSANKEIWNQNSQIGTL